MRDLTSIQNMLPDLENKLAFMYYNTVVQSKHLIDVDKTQYREAEVHLNLINTLFTCDPQVNEVNYHLNELLKLLQTCCLPEICEADVIELQCQADLTPTTYWVPDAIACDFTPADYAIRATVTTFTSPADLLGRYPSSVSELECTLKAETGSNKQYILLQSDFPKTIVGIQYYSNALAAYIEINKVSEFDESSITGYTKFQYIGAKRGSIQVKIIFG